MSGYSTVPRALAESSRNALLRRVDWRFLLRNTQQPRTVNLAAGDLSAGVDLVMAMDGGASPGTPDLVVLGRPTRSALARARAALRPGGEVYGEWRVPVLAMPRRIRGQLRRAGFVDVRIHWAWPWPQRSTPVFWLPVDTPAGVARFLALRPARSQRQDVMRTVWGLLARAGLLAPVSVLARRPDAAAGSDMLMLTERLGEDSPSPVGGSPADRTSWLLLTGGQQSINKVVGVPVQEQQVRPFVVKFARVPEMDAALAHEATVLRALESELPGLPGVPRVLALSRRAGRIALVQTAHHGEPLVDVLTATTFPALAQHVTRWLVDLSGSGPSRPRADWWPRLVEAPLDDFVARFGSVVDAETLARARARLNELPDLPLGCEHRDCAPWNIVLTGGESPALLDWESAELHGLPGLDLIYFLANSAFVLEGALSSGRTREAYARLLDPNTRLGAVAAACFNAYGARLGIGMETLDRLRMLCWIVHCRSDHRRLQRDIAGAPEPAALKASPFLGLFSEEVRRTHHRQR